MRPDRLAAVIGVQAIAFVGAGDEEAERALGINARLIGRQV
jgi:hypothetical protein